jgi:hypothetical protein
MRRPPTRRAFLASAGLGLGLLPLLGARRSRADALPRRLLVIVQTNGTIADAFFPQGAGSDLSKLTFPAITKPLEPHRGEITFVENLALSHFNELPNNGGAHENYAVAFTGHPGEQRNVGDPRGIRPPYATTPTIDQHIVAGLQLQGAGTPLPKVHMGVQVENAPEHQKRCFWRGRGQPSTPENDPNRVAASLFGPSMQDSQFERLRIEQRSVLDFVGKDLERFAGRLASEDRLKVEAHLASVRAIEEQLRAAPAVSCKAPPCLPASRPRRPVRTRTGAR